MKQKEKYIPIPKLGSWELRLNFIRDLIPQVEKSLKNAPSGTLRISMKGKSARYYFRHSGGDFNGEYLSKPNMQLVTKLAQKSYDQKLIKSLKKEAKLLKQLLHLYKTKNADRIYEKLSPPRQKLVIPITQPFLQFQQEWKNADFITNPYHRESLIFTVNTIPQIQVRSKSEVMIAEALIANRIPFRYEQQLAIKNGRFAYPDFTCLNLHSGKELIWEHFGFMDDADYVSKTVEKINLYESCGFRLGVNFIATFEDDANPLTPQKIKKQIESYFS